jgi:hypothetical protein
MKHALCFLAGTVLSTIAVVLNGGRALGMVALGFLLACSILMGVAYFVGIERLVRVLNALADSAPATRSTAARRRVSDPSGYIKPSRKRQIQDVEDTIEEYKMRQSERHPATARTPEVAAFLNDPELFDSTVQ